MRNFAVVTAGGLGLVLLAMGALWWRLSSGPISLDLATPWLSAAIADNFGKGHRVEVGGTQLERDEEGRTALRIRDIVVRDADGTVVASAPKAEVGFSGWALLSGRVHAQRLSLVGAEMSLRIDTGGSVTVFAGADKRPLVSASVTGAGPSAQPPAARPEQPPQNVGSPAAGTEQGGRNGDQFAAMLAWIDSLSASGLDGYELNELGLKNGRLLVDDRRRGKQVVFENINLSLTRPRPGTVVLTAGSDSATGPWELQAALALTAAGHRVIQLDARKVPARHLLLASRVGEGRVDADVPLSGRLLAEIAPDGTPQSIDGRFVAEKGMIGDPDHPADLFALDRAELSLEWDPLRRALVMPFQIASGRSRATLLAQFDPPAVAGGAWNFGLSGGTMVLAGAEGTDEKPVVLNRILVRLRADLGKKLISLDQVDVGNSEFGVAASGAFDFSGDEPRLALGMASNRMSVSAFKRLWPPFLKPAVRNWVDNHVLSGSIDKAVLAVRSPVPALLPGGPVLSDDALSIELSGGGVVLRPVDMLPEIREADLKVRITGRTTTITLGRGTIEMPSGRKLTMSGGTFEVPDTAEQTPRSQTRFRIEGPVPAAAELLASDRLRDFSGAPVDPATSRGTLAAQVAVALPLRPDLPPGSADYNLNVDLAGFSVDRMVMGQKVEAATLKILANTQGYYVKGDVKIGGTPATVEYRRPRGDGEADLRIQTSLDDATRARFGLDLGPGVNGSIPVKAAGKIGTGERDYRFTVEADLGPAKIDNLLPGWVKPSGKPVRAAFTVSAKPQSTRIDDLSIEGSGTAVKGNLELDPAGELLSANFPVYGPSDGDKATLKAERSPDGTLRVSLRGDVYDGRGFLKSTFSGTDRKPAKGQGRAEDLDLEIKVGAVAGFHGEALRGLDLKLSRRAGEIRSFGLSGKLGRDTALTGDLRGGRGGRSMLHLSTEDAGAFLRLADIYARMSGGQMWVAMDPPSSEPGSQEGTLNIRDFLVRGEQALDTAVSNAPANARNGIEFSSMNVLFTRTPGRVTVRDGVVKGPMLGATIEGAIDYPRDEVRMRGTLVPLYGLNNMLNQIPIVGLFLGGSNEGLLGITYEVTGPPTAPVLRVNPISAVAPGIMRKFFEFPSNSGRGVQGVENRSFADPRN